MRETEKYREREKENKRSVKIMKRNNSKKAKALSPLCSFPFPIFSIAPDLNEYHGRPSYSRTSPLEDGRETGHKKHNSATMTRRVHAQTHTYTRLNAALSQGHRQKKCMVFLSLLMLCSVTGAFVQPSVLWEEWNTVWKHPQERKNHKRVLFNISIYSPG